FFITSADSATYVLAMLSDDGNLKPKNNLKIFWGVLLATIAIVLLLSGGLVALQNTLIIVAFPFSLIMVLIMVSLVIELLHEKDKMGLSITPTRYPKKDQPFKSYEE
ncbi:MAG: BCCT family transporter, partial [Streptococcus vestibularis]|nr:BCCT family transporter [Streptococcus vestibularis]